jgi:hypothetical protein
VSDVTSVQVATSWRLRSMPPCLVAKGEVSQLKLQCAIFLSCDCDKNPSAGTVVGLWVGVGNFSHVTVTKIPCLQGQS